MIHQAHEEAIITNIHSYQNISTHEKL